MKFALLLSLFLLFLFGCSTTDTDQSVKTDAISIHLSVGNISTKALQAIDSLPLSVNRILIIPFQQLDMTQPNSNISNFIPVWNFAHQYDINTFPANTLQLSLPKSFTYKVLILGYNRNDYDYYNPNVSNNRFDIRTQPIPTTLANFQLSSKAAHHVPEFFSCFCSALINDINTGDIFTPGSGTDITLSGNLQRIVSGLDVYLTNVPAYVTSVSLSGGNLVKTIQLIDTTAIQAQTPGDGENRVVGQIVPQAKTFRFNVFLFPTQTLYKTPFYLNVYYDTRSTSYQINVPDSPYSLNKELILKPNRAIKITGNFSKTGISFEVNNAINLDDNNWDGFTN